MLLYADHITVFVGHMNCYFRLASQFRTQDDPAYCGLATLVMILNALEIDPGRIWKGWLMYAHVSEILITHVILYSVHVP